MNIDILCASGSPIGVTPLEINDRGMGGAELALMRIVDGLSQRGHRIRVYNSPRVPYHTENLTFFSVNSYQPGEKRDVLITFRGHMKDQLAGSVYGKHIGFSCDQFTTSNYTEWYNSVSKMVLISEFHKNDHIKRYGSIVNDKAIITDLGVLNREYNQPLNKISNQFIFCSVPDRGLTEVYTIWPKIIERIPDAKLVITSDYRLWGVTDPNNLQHKLRFHGMPNVEFLGKIPRNELIERQLESEIHLYPCTYDENFCISVAETQSAGCLALTSARGALYTTNFTGKILTSHDEFIHESVNFLQKPIDERKDIQINIQQKALNRFDWNKILDKWETEILV